MYYWVFYVFSHNKKESKSGNTPSTSTLSTHLNRHRNYLIVNIKKKQMIFLLNTKVRQFRANKITIRNEHKTTWVFLNSQRGKTRMKLVAIWFYYRKHFHGNLKDDLMRWNDGVDGETKCFVSSFWGLDTYFFSYSLDQTLQT